MKNGAAFGDGIYLAADVKVARSFASWGPQVRTTLLKADLSFLGGGHED